MSMTKSCNLDDIEIVDGELRKYKGNEAKVVIPDGVTSIGGDAFRGYLKLEAVIIPDSVTSIGACAFLWCRKLKEINIPNGVTSIGFSAFSDCVDLNYNIKDELKYLGDSNNPYLYLAGTTSTDISVANIDGNCKFIGDFAFEDCSNLSRINIPDNVISIQGNSFSGCKNLHYNVKDNLKYLGNTNNPYMCLITPPRDAYTLSAIKSANIDGNCRLIADEAFHDCRVLEKVIIPDSVTIIGRQVFRHCEKLKEIQVGKNNLAYKSVGGGLYSKNGKTLIVVTAGKKLSSFKISMGVTSIADYAFSYCSHLKKVVIPDSVTSIGLGAFERCCKLESINIPDSVTNMTGVIFSWCTKLTSATIGKGVTWISERAFLKCDSLKKVTFCDDQGWYATTDDEKFRRRVGGKRIDFSDPEKNAEYLKTRRVGDARIYKI